MSLASNDLLAMASDDKSSTVGYLLVFSGVAIAVGVGLAATQRTSAWLWALPITAIMLWTVYQIAVQAEQDSEALRCKLTSSHGGYR